VAEEAIEARAQRAAQRVRRPGDGEDQAAVGAGALAVVVPAQLRGPAVARSALLVLERCAFDHRREQRGRGTPQARKIAIEVEVAASGEGVQGGEEVGAGVVLVAEALVVEPGIAEMLAEGQHPTGGPVDALLEIVLAAAEIACRTGREQRPRMGDRPPVVADLVRIALAHLLEAAVHVDQACGERGTAFAVHCGPGAVGDLGAEQSPEADPQVAAAPGAGHPQVGVDRALGEDRLAGEHVVAGAGGGMIVDREHSLAVVVGFGGPRLGRIACGDRGNVGGEAGRVRVAGCAVAAGAGEVVVVEEDRHHGPQRWTRALPPATSFSTSARVAIEVSPGVVIARAPCAAPSSTARFGSPPLRKP